MKLSRQHFEYIADILNCMKPVKPTPKEFALWEKICLKFAYENSLYNPRYDRERFLKACGLEQK